MSKTLALGAVCVASLCGVASADLIIGNLGDNSGGGTLFGDGATTLHKAAGFAMGADSYFLDEVVLTIRDATPGSTAHVQIWEGAGVPQNMVADLTSFSFGGHAGDQDFTWTPNSQVTLNAGQTYWVYLENIFNAGDSFLWSSGNTVPTGPGATSAGFIFNGGSSSFMNTYGVFGTVVPAPAGLAAAGVLGLFAARRRR
jgi:hypothetical protein